MARIPEHNTYASPGCRGAEHARTHCWLELLPASSPGSYTVGGPADSAVVVGI